MGITGTPIVDLASRALFFDAMITPDGGQPRNISLFAQCGHRRHQSRLARGCGGDSFIQRHDFTPAIQQQRPALGIVGNILYVGYGSMADCSRYHGWLVGVPIDNPASVTAWAAATDTHGGAIWGVGGVASDGKNPFVTTGNTFNPGGNWSGGEAVIRFQPGPIFSGSPADYWVPCKLARSR